MPPKIIVKQKRKKRVTEKGKERDLIQCMVIKIKLLGFHFLHIQAEIITKVQI